MSTYGGFATQGQEMQYNTTMFRIMHALQSKLKQSLQIIERFRVLTTNQESERQWTADNFESLFFGLYYQMQQMENVKYSPLKFSISVKDLVTFLELSGSVNSETQSAKCILLQILYLDDQSITASQYKDILSDIKSNQERSMNSQVTVAAMVDLDESGNWITHSNSFRWAKYA